MRKLLFLTFAAVLSIAAHAQTRVLQRDPGTVETHSCPLITRRQSRR